MKTLFKILLFYFGLCLFTWLVDIIRLYLIEGGNLDAYNPVSQFFNRARMVVWAPLYVMSLPFWPVLEIIGQLRPGPPHNVIEIKTPSIIGYGIVMISYLGALKGILYFFGKSTNLSRSK